MSSILNALKKLEDETEQGGQEHSLPAFPDTKQVVRKGIRENRGYGKILWTCFGITVLIGLVWFAAARNPATAPDQIYSQSENPAPWDSDAKSADPASSKAVLKHKAPAHAENKAETPKTDTSAPASVSVPVPPAPAGTQENMSKFRDMAAKQMKNEGENDPFRIPDELRETVSTVPEKTGEKTASETVKPASPAGIPVPLIPESKNPVKTEPVPMLPAPENPVKTEPVPMLPASKNPVKTEPVPMLPASKNPVKTETAVSVSQPLPVPDVKKMQNAQSGSGQPESVKMPVPSEPIKKTAQPEPVKTPSGSEPTKSSARSEPVKASAPPEQKDCSSVKEKTAGVTGLAIQALVWSEDPAGRMAVINGNIVREKGMLADVSVIRIASDCIVFQKGNEQWMQKFRLN